MLLRRIKSCAEILEVVRFGVLGESRGLGGKEARCQELYPTKVARQRNAHDGPDPASVQAVLVSYSLKQVN